MLCNGNNLKPNWKKNGKRERENNVCLRVTKIFTLNTSPLIVSGGWDTKNHKDENTDGTRKFNANFINITSAAAAAAQKVCCFLKLEYLFHSPSLCIALAFSFFYYMRFKITICMVFTMLKIWL